MRQEGEQQGPSVPPPLESPAAQGQPSEPDLSRPAPELRERPASPEEEEVAAALAALSNLAHIQSPSAAAPEAQLPSAAAAVSANGVDPRASPAESAAVRKLAAGVTAEAERLRKGGKPQQQRPQLSGPHLVASKLAAAATAASAAAAAAAAPLASGVSSLASAGGATVASQLQSAASAGTSTAVATFATVSAGAHGSDL